jgi:hypothetical protein
LEPELKRRENQKNKRRASNDPGAIQHRQSKIAIVILHHLRFAALRAHTKAIVVRGASAHFSTTSRGSGERGSAAIPFRIPKRR